jgi:hydrogenase maturation protease
MEASIRNNTKIRVLCLGNDILADDALGIRVAEKLRGRVPDAVDIAESMESGYHLLDYLLGVNRVVVVETVKTGGQPPGFIYELGEGDFDTIPGTSPHYIGLFETLALGRELGLDVAAELVIIAVEAVDCMTVGGDMNPVVERAIPGVIERVEELVGLKCTSSESQVPSSKR